MNIFDIRFYLAIGLGIYLVLFQSFPNHTEIGIAFIVGGIFWIALRGWLRKQNEFADNTMSEKQKTSNFGVLIVIVLVVIVLFAMWTNQQGKKTGVPENPILPTSQATHQTVSIDGTELSADATIVARITMLGCMNIDAIWRNGERFNGKGGVCVIGRIIDTSISTGENPYSAYFSVNPNKFELFGKVDMADHVGECLMFGGTVFVSTNGTVVMLTDLDKKLFLYEVISDKYCSKDK